MAFRDRFEAGRLLGDRLARTRWAPTRPVVLGLPRGGVPVAAEIARALRAPLDVLVVRKLGHPGQPELGLGAIGEGGVRVTNDRLVTQLGIGPEVLDAVARREGAELRRRVQAYRGDRPQLAVDGRVVVVVDDGLATGFTARAGVEIVRRRGAGHVVLAVPVAPASTLDALAGEVDDVVCPARPDDFLGIGEWYSDFHQVSDAEVRRLLAPAAAEADPADEADTGDGTDGGPDRHPPA
jgi:putative phosphoribosyl transferase